MSQLLSGSISVDGVSQYINSNFTPSVGRPILYGTGGGLDTNIGYSSQDLWENSSVTQTVTTVSPNSTPIIIDFKDRYYWGGADQQTWVESEVAPKEQEITVENFLDNIL